jgi:hypothetical protein
MGQGQASHRGRPAWRMHTDNVREAAMVIHLTESERSRLRGMVKRPRSRKQLYRAESLLELGDGRPIEEVARRHRMGVERVEAWVEEFNRLRMRYLEEPDAGRPAPRGELAPEGGDD